MANAKVFGNGVAGEFIMPDEEIKQVYFQLHEIANTLGLAQSKVRFYIQFLDIPHQRRKLKINAEGVEKLKAFHRLTKLGLSLPLAKKNLHKAEQLIKLLNK